MRIALVTTDLSGRSGWSRYTADLARVLTEMGHDVSAAVEREARAAPCRETVLLPSFEACLGSALRRRFAARRLDRWLGTLEPDVVHFTAEPYALLLPLLSAPRRWRSVVTLHGSYAVIPLATRGRTGVLARESFRTVDAVITVSQFTRRYLADTFPEVHAELERDAKIVVIPNGVALPSPPAPRPGKDALEPRRILGVGGVKARKGFLEAVEACARFDAESRVPFRYDIVGSLEQSGRYPSRLRKRIRERGLEDRVLVRGVLDDRELSRAYDEADLFLLLSLQGHSKVEGFGLVFLEANAHGVPVIGPDTGGCPEAIVHGRTGYVCDPHDPDAVARAMRLVLEEGTIEPAACRAWAEAHDVRGVAERLLAVYRGGG